MKRIPFPVLAIIGPTGVGKTSTSLNLANELGCEIIGMDSMQVYRYMDIGTAKIKPDETAGIPHHLIDIVDPDEEYDAARFVSDALRAMTDIRGRGRTPLLVGGTGLYLKALTSGLFEGVPENQAIREELRKRIVVEGSLKLHDELKECDSSSAERIHPNDSSRILRGLEIYLASGIPWSEHLEKQGRDDRKGAVQSILPIALTCPRPMLYQRINLRTEIMIEDGLEQEVNTLLEMGYYRDLKSMGSIGYRHMLHYIYKEWSIEEMLEKLARDTRRYAKRQYTWFERVPDIEWFLKDDMHGVISRAAEWLSSRK